MCGLLLNGIFLGGGRHVWSTHRLRLRLGIVLGVGYTQIQMFLGHIRYIYLEEGVWSKIVSGL